MLLVDLALQGFRDLRGAAQARFRSGYNGVVCPGVSPETVLTGLLELLFAEGYDPAAVRFAAPGVSSTRGAITLAGPDRSTFRLLRDIVKGSAQLNAYDPATRQFSAVTTQAVEIAQFIRGRIGLPSRKTFEAAFVLTEESLPSRQKGTQSAGAAPVARQTPAQMALSSDERAFLETRLKQLEGALAARDTISTLEYELDGLQKRRFEIEDRLKLLAFDESRLLDAQAEVERLRFADVLPDDFGERYEEYTEKVALRDTELQRWTAEREELERISRMASVEPLSKDWRLWGGLAVGALGLGVGFALGGPYRYLAFLDIPAFGIAALALWQNLTARDEIITAKRRLELSDRRRERIVERDAEAIANVELLLDQTGITGPGELLRVLDERVRAREALAAALAERDVAVSNPELAELASQRAELDAQILQLETDLAGATASGSDLAGMQHEVEELRERLAGGSRATSAVAAPIAEVAEPGFSCLALLEAGEDLLLARRDAVLEKLDAQASRLAAQLSNGRVAEVQLDLGGRVFATVEGQRKPLAELPAALHDVVYLALRGGLLTSLEARLAQPLLMTQLTSQAPGWAALIKVYASSLAQAGVQVLYFTAQPEACAGAAHVVTFEAS